MAPRSMGIRSGFWKLSTLARRSREVTVSSPILTYRIRLFRGRLFMEVAPGDRSDLETLPGTYRTAVHRGSWSKIGSTIRELKARTTYLWYLTCPECSSAENHITVVLGR